MGRASHFDKAGTARMVDVSAKPATRRTATARAFVRMNRATVRALQDNPKGNPLEVARIAGIQAAKRTAELIPLCHPLALTHADVEVRVTRDGVRIEATAATTAQTGVEMEALTAASVAALCSGWRANTKFAADGTTSKPNACKSAVSRSRLAMTFVQVSRNQSSSSTAAIAAACASRSSG